MDKAVEKSFGYDFEKIDEESSYANSRGYFFLITKCLAASADALMNRDLSKEIDSLYLLRRLLIGYFKEGELAQTDADFRKAQQIVQDYYSCLSQKLDYKARVRYNEARAILNKLGDDMSLKMHQANLYTLLREKGNVLYA